MSPKSLAKSVCNGHGFVAGEGPDDADVMLIGQNPGREEDRTGRPFIGRAGKYLDKTLEKFGLDRSRMFITSVVKCRTPNNRKPNRDEIEKSIPYLMEQINRIRPKVIVLMGEIAWKTPRIEGVEYIQTYHPAAAMRFPKIRKKFEEDFEKLKEVII